MAAVDLRPGPAALLEQSMAPDDDGTRGDVALRAEPGQRLHAIGTRQRDSVGRRTFHDRPADRMLGSRFERCREREDVGGLRAVDRHDVGDAEAAFGQRTGLVERHAADGCEPLEPRAALDEHALARRRGQRRDDRDGRRDDERARARDDQQHERSIDPRAPRPARQHRRHERRSRPPARARSACRRARTDRRTSGSAPAAPARARRGG